MKPEPRRNAMLRAVRPRPIFSMLSSDGQSHYILVVNGDGEIACNCPAGEFRVSCKHVRRTRASIRRRLQELERMARRG